jgi:microcompartment protein CcmL/EutN
MAIQPIDLQALFTQLDKVAKSQVIQREGQQIQEALQQAQNQRKLEQNVQSVNQSQQMGEEAATIKDEQRRGANANQGRIMGKQEDEDEALAPEEEDRDFIRDPALGRNLDISG